MVVFVACCVDVGSELAPVVVAASVCRGRVAASVGVCVGVGLNVEVSSASAWEKGLQ